VALAALIGWFAFVRQQPVPLLDGFDFAVHEAGHLIAFPLPKIGMFMAGSIAQVAFPLAMAAYFAVRRDPAAAGFCVAWAGASMWDVSVYVADAPVQALPIVGGSHDWAYILGYFGALDRAGAIAGWIELAGGIVLLAGIGLCFVPAPGPSPAVASSLRTRPVRDTIEVSGDPWASG
jgi:hypothetical protein